MSNSRFNLFQRPKNPLVIERIISENLRLIMNISLVATLVETLVLLTFLLFGTNEDVETWRVSGLSVAFCILLCGIVYLASKHIGRKEYTAKQLRWRVLTLQYTFYELLAIWGVWVDYRHYRNGDQMQTFYVVQFLFVCFLTFHPIMGPIFTTIPFGVLFGLLIAYDGADHANINNYFAFIAFSIVAVLFRYRTELGRQETQLDLEKSNGILNTTAMIDELTGLKNRRSFRIDFLKFTGKDCAVVLLDVDKFKKINDTYGHLAGDEVLRKVSAALADVFGKDYVYRYGGDEFLVVIPHKIERETIISKMGEVNIRIHVIQVENDSLHVHCSYGTCIDHMNDENKLREALRRADEGLYQQKKFTTEFGDSAEVVDITGEQEAEVPSEDSVLTDEIQEEEAKSEEILKKVENEESEKEI